MKIIGITGRYGGGKSLVASLLEKKGAFRLDVDSVGHEVLNSSKREIQSSFGPEALTKKGEVDRKFLKKVVFSDSDKLRQLEAIVHPLMFQKIVLLIEDYKKEGLSTFLLDAALLHRMGLDTLCDTICFVKTPCIIRLIRAIKRDKVKLKTFMQIEKAQKDIRVSTLLGVQSLYIIANWGPKRFLYRQVDEFWASIGV